MKFFHLKRISAFLHHEAHHFGFKTFEVLLDFDDGVCVDVDFFFLAEVLVVMRNVTGIQDIVFDRIGVLS